MKNESANNESVQIYQFTKEIAALKKQNTELSETGFELIKNQTKLQSLLHNASDGIITFTADGTVESFNLAAQRIFGYKEVEIVTRKIAHLIPCPDWIENNVGAYIRYFISSRHSEDIPLLGKHKTGFDILLHVSIGEASDTNTELFGDDIETSNLFEDTSQEQSDQTEEQQSPIVCFFRDITDNKKLEKELQDHKHALDLAAGVIVSDKDFRITDVNDLFCVMLERNRHQFIGEQYIQSKFIGLPEDKAVLETKKTHLSQGKAWIGESCFLSSRGKQVWFNESTTPFLNSDNEPYQYLTILIDITERKQFEVQLEQHRDHLQDLVNEQVEDIKTARDKAERASQAKTVFLTNMSHELRTPMHSILSFTHLRLKQFNKQPLKQDQINKLIKFLNNIEVSGERLLGLLNNLLDLSQFESGKDNYNFKENNLYLLTLLAYTQDTAKFSHKNITIDLAKPTNTIQPICDKTKTLQVLNLLNDNAIQFSPKNSTIKVTLESTILEIDNEEGIKTTQNGILFSIKYQGIGIPDNKLSTIFDKFTQSSKTKSDTGGRGLGLCIYQEIIDAHKDTIWAEHNPEGGSIFKFFLPHDST